MPTNNLSVPGIVGIAILVILVLVIIVRNIYVVQQSRAYVVERLGAFHSVWGVGLHMKGTFRINLPEIFILQPPPSCLS